MSYSALQNYQCQTALGKGHKRFGPVDARVEDDDDGGDGTRGYQPEGNAIPPHPLLAQAAQFSGDDKLETPVNAENEDAQDAYELQMANKHQKQLQNSNQHVATPSPLK